MPSSCDTTKKSVASIINNDNKKRENSKYSGKVNDILQNLLDEGILYGTDIDEGKIDKAFAKVYGTKEKRLLFVKKLYALLDANQGIVDIVQQFIMDNPPGIALTSVQKGLGDRKIQLAAKLGTPEDGFILENYPEKSLRLYYAMAHKMATTINPEGKAYANFGGILSSLRTTKGLSWKEPTGAFYNITRATKNYPAKVSSRINIFMTSIKEMKVIAKKFNIEGKDIPRMSMEQIQSNLKNLSVDKNSRGIQSLFHRYMMGHIRIQDGEFFIHKDYDLKRDENGKVMTYPNGDLMFSFSNLVKLKDYEDKDVGIRKGEWFIPMGKESMNKFVKYANEARKIDNLVFKYMENHMNESLYGKEGLIGELSKTFPKLMPDQIKEIFFNPDSKGSKALIKTLNKGDRKLYNEMQEVFSMYIGDEFIIANGGKVEYKENHFPVMYNREVYKMMVDTMLVDYSNKLDEIDSIMSDKDEIAKMAKDTGKKVSDVKRTLRSLKNEITSKKNYANRVLNNMDGYRIETAHNTTIPFAKDNKYFKRISNAYDIRSTRTDDSVYYDYLKNVMTTVERNFLTAQLVKTLRMADNDAVKRTSIQLYKVLFSDPTTEGLFGGTVEGMSGMFGSFTTPESLNRMLRNIGTTISGMYLGGIGTVATNFSAIQQNIIDYGWQNMNEAMELLGDKSIRPKIDDIIKRSGIAEFSDFFSKAMVNGLVEEELESDISYAILGEMAIYHDNVRKGMSKAKARDRFNENVGKYLDKSSVFLKDGPSKVFIHSPKGIERRRKDLNRNWRERKIRTLLDYAITKEYNFKAALEELPLSNIKKYVREPITNFALGAGKFWGSILQNIGWTMSSTEQYIRTVSFITGVLRAQRQGLLPNDVNFWEIKDEEVISQMIEIGRSANEFTNFGLSTQEVGRYNWNNMGKLFGKFKVWPQQKFGRDINIIKNAYLANKKIGKIESNTIDHVAVAKVIKGLFNKKGKQLRIADSEAQAMKTFLFGQGFTQIMWDLFIQGPIRIPFLSRMAYNSMLGKTTRSVGSDLLSFLLSPIALGLNLFMPNPFDEDEIERTSNYYLRRTFLGYVPILFFDALWTIYYMANEDKRAMISKIPMPLPPVMSRSVKELVYYFLKD